MTAVLIVEDEPGLREGLVGAVETLGYVAVPAAGLGEARQRLGREQIDCVLLDIRLRDGDGLELLRELRSGAHRDVPVIIATAYGDSERTIRAMRDGAFDYLTKPFDFPLLLATVSRAVKQRALAAALAPPAPAAARGGLVGASTAMLGIWKLIGRAAASDAPVLITGETGTGKELVARAVHDYSARAKEPFVAVNVAALPATLLESELFGHERGAFTGAAARRAGRIEAAGAGTLFLDEIGDVEPAMQSKLLRVLSDGSYERVGGDEPLTARARIVSATHKPVRPGEPGCVLREDLYYRLAVIEIEVPPLRARKSDIPLLVAHALSGTAARAVSEEAMARLLDLSLARQRARAHPRHSARGGAVRRRDHRRLELARAGARRARHAVAGRSRRAVAARGAGGARKAHDRARARTRQRQPLGGRPPARHRPPAALRQARRARLGRRQGKLNRRTARQ